MKSFVGVFAALVLVAGGVYGIQQLKAGEECAAHAKAASAGTDAKVEATNATATTTTSTTPACCAGKATATAATAGAQCTYNAKTASAQCTGADMASHAECQVLTAEATFAKLAQCGIDCRKVDAGVLAAKLTTAHCCAYTQEQWTTMIKSAQALDAKQADAIFASATADHKCSAEGCPMSKVAAELAAAQGEQKKSSSN
jgi:hypothetical protein